MVLQLYIIEYFMFRINLIIIVTLALAKTVAVSKQLLNLRPIITSRKLNFVTGELDNN